jgi:hypothetical protein
MHFVVDIAVWEAHIASCQKHNTPGNEMLMSEKTYVYLVIDGVETKTPEEVAGDDAIGLLAAVNAAFLSGYCVHIYQQQADALANSDAELFSEGMQAAACDLFIKDCPYPKNGKKAAVWREGFWEAYRYLNLRSN